MAANMHHEDIKDNITVDNMRQKGVIKKTRKPRKKLTRKDEDKGQARKQDSILPLKTNDERDGRIPVSQQQQNRNRLPSSSSDPPVHVQKEICMEEYITMPDTSGDSFFCRLCYYRCSSWVYLVKHIEQAWHSQLRMEKQEFDCSLLIPSPTPGQMKHINEMVQNLVQQYGLKTNERRFRISVGFRIRSWLSRQVDGCTIDIYGSTLFAGLKTSDVNFNLTIPNEKNTHDVMKALFEMLERDDFVETVNLDFKTDVPRLVFHTKSKTLTCTICVNQQSALDIARLCEKYKCMDDRARPLAVLFRLWAKECMLDQAELATLPPHAFSLMTIYYLQQVDKPVLPVLQELIKRELSTFDLTKEEEIILSKWRSQNTMSLGELWLGMLKFYLHEFRMKEHVISITSREPVLRAAKKWSGRGMAIEDPFMPKKNVGRHMLLNSISSYFVSCLLRTYKYFMIPQTVNGPLFERVEPGLIDTFLDQDSEFQGLQERFKRMTLASANCFIVDRNKKSAIVCPFQAKILCEELPVESLRYSFGRKQFTGGKELPKHCVVCKEEGHTAPECSLGVLPPLEELPPLVPSYVNIISFLCEYVFEFYALQEVNYQIRVAIVKELETHMQTAFSGIKLTLFGSSCNGFGLNSSDIDVCAVFNSSKHGEDLNFAAIIEELGLYLQSRSLFREVVPVTTARVPILKFYDPDYNLEGDISMYNLLGQVNTKLLKAYSEIDRRVKILGVVMKRFARVCDICHAARGSLSSYAFILMVIYFLQQCEPPVLPVLQELPEADKTPVHMLKDCNTYFFNDLKNLHKVWPQYGRNRTSVGELWIKLLCFYAEEFDFEHTVISIRQKAKLLRRDKFWSNNWSGRHLSIEDPFDHSHNLACHLSRKMHTYIMQSFRKARLHFGFRRRIASTDVNFLMCHFFDPDSLTDGPAPDIGCHICKKIGHKVKDCPQKKKKHKGVKQNESNSPQVQGGKRQFQTRKPEFEKH